MEFRKGEKEEGRKEGRKGKTEREKERRKGKKLKAIRLERKK